MQVEIVEVGPRDGLQNDAVLFSTEQKLAYIGRTVEAGVRRVEVASFVHPGRVPQMADAEAVLAGLSKGSSSYIGLVLNARGFERARETTVDEVNLVVVSTDTFAQRNQGMTTAQLVDVVREVAPLATAAGIRPTVTLAASFGCPYEGEVPVERTVELALACAEAGVAEVALADTIGVGVPADVRRRIAAVRDQLGADLPLRAHFHNTRNTGYANALAAVEAGVTALDASTGGIGGCPFAPNATGNIATEDLVYLLERSGVSTGVDLDALIRTAEWLAAELGRPVPGLLSKAGPFPRSSS